MMAAFLPHILLAVIGFSLGPRYSDGKITESFFGPLPMKTIKCYLTEQNAQKATHLKAILVTKAGIEDPKEAIWSVSKTPSKLGVVSSNPLESYLQVFVEDLDEEYGKMNCIFVTKRHGYERTFVQDAEIQYHEKVYDRNMLKDFHIITRNLTEMRRNYKYLFEKQKMKIAKVKAKLDHFEELYSNTTLKLEDILRDQANNLQMAEENENMTVMFIALQSPSDFLDSKTPIYTNVVANEGNGYDRKSGIFTAPVDGYYLFHFSVFISDPAYIYLDLKSNGRIIKKIVGGDKDKWRRYSDGTCIIKLRKHQEVYQEVNRRGGKIDSYTFRDENFHNRFDGHLLKVSHWDD